METLDWVAFFYMFLGAFGVGWGIGSFLINRKNRKKISPRFTPPTPLLLKIHGQEYIRLEANGQISIRGEVTEDEKQIVWALNHYARVKLLEEL